MDYNEYLFWIDSTEDKDRLEQLLKQIEDDEALPSRAYCSLRSYVIKRIYSVSIYYGC